MRNVYAAVLSTALVASNAFAATQSASTLPAGKPAGMKQAALTGPRWAIIFVGAGIVVGGLALTLGDSNKGVTSPTTSSTKGAP